MFAKITNLFQSQNNPASNLSAPPPNHPKIDSTDSAQCPFMSKQTKKQTKNNNVSQNNPQTSKNREIDSDSQQQKPKGGCPFMGTSQKKKNPSLGLNSEGYDEPFVSKFKYYLSASKMDFSNLYNKNKSLPVGRQIFEKYPIYLQNTLFYNGEDYQKVRGMECCSRFMAYQQLREKGNKYYNKGKYYLALEYYQRAMSLFRWLQYHQIQNETVLSESRSSASLQNIDQSSQNDSKINIKVSQRNQEQNNPFEELRQKYKEFFITYNDDNTKYFDGEQLGETPDIDMRKSLLVQVYLNMAAAYINLHHYSLAQQIINDGLTLSENVSQLYFRKAQSISLNKASSLQKLKEAKKLIEKAIEMRPKQKIFNSANTNILKMLNLHDSEQSYKFCYEYLQKSLQQKQKKSVYSYQRLYNRAKQINQIQKRLISEGKIPKQNLSQKVLHNTLQIKCLDKMINKYGKVIEFYTQAKNQEQVALAKKQYQEVLRIAAQVAVIFQLKIVEKSNELGGIQTDKIQKRINIIKSRCAEDIYNSGKYNFTMMEWAIKQIVKEQAEQQKAKEAEVKVDQVIKTEQKKQNSLYMLMVIIPLVLIFLSSFML